MTIEELEAKLETVSRERDEARAEVQRLTDERDELLVRVAEQGAELRATREAYNGARTDVPALIARVRELEAALRDIASGDYSNPFSIKTPEPRTEEPTNG